MNGKILLIFAIFGAVSVTGDQYGDELTTLYDAVMKKLATKVDNMIAVVKDDEVKKCVVLQVEQSVGLVQQELQTLVTTTQKKLDALSPDAVACNRAKIVKTYKSELAKLAKKNYKPIVELTKSLIKLCNLAMPSSEN